MKIITGMHRSGTSMVARLFHAVGANLGNEKTFYRPDKWNPDGYFEQPDIHAVNFPLINGPFWKFSYLFLPSEKTILRRARSMSDRILQTAEKYKNAVIKETRFCLTLPAWKEASATPEKILVCLREPIQVASSLKKRNWISLRMGLDLWKVHNVRLLKYIENIPHRFVSYHNVLDPAMFSREVKPALAFFGNPISDDKFEALRNEHVKPGMNNNSFVSERYPADIQALWDHLQKLHSKQ